MNSELDFLNDDSQDVASSASEGIDIGDFDLKLSDDLLAEALKAVDMTNVAESAADVPFVSQDAGLPSPKSSAPGLPSPKASVPGLPSPKPVVAGLPSPKPVVAGLPSPKEPSPGLPSPKASVPGLPSPKPVVVGLPSPKEPSLGLPKPKIVPPAAQRHNTMAFSPRTFDSNSVIAPNGQEKSPEDSSLDIPRLKLSDDAHQPMLKLEHDAPTGAFSPSNEFDDNSGLPLSDDPLGLIGAPHGSGVPPMPEAAESVFFAQTHNPNQERAAAAPANDDILGLFEQPELSPAPVPLIDEPAPSPVPTMPPADLPKPPPQMPNAGMRSMYATEGASSAIQAPAELPQIPEAEEPAPEEAGELVFDVKSIQSGGGSAAPVKVIESSKQIGRRKSQKMRRIIRVCSIVGVVLLIGAALAAYVVKLRTDTPENTVINFEQSKVDVRWDVVFADRDIAYQTFFKKAVERLGQADVSSDEKVELQGKSLIDVVLASTFDDSVFTDDDVAMLDTSAKTISTTCVSEWCSVGLYSWGLFRQNDELIVAYKHKLPSEGDLASIVKIVGMSVRFHQWRLDGQTYDERIAYGEKLLDEIGDDFDWKKYPIAARIKATTLMRIGRFEEAYRLVSDLRTEEGTPLSPALALVEFDINTALDRVEMGEPLLTYLKSIQNLSVSNRKALAIRELQYSASTIENVEFYKSLEEFIKSHATQPDLVYAGVRMCSYLQAYTECRMMLTNVLKSSPGNLDVLMSLVGVSLLQQGISELVRPDVVLPEPVYSAIDDVLSKGLNDNPQQSQLWKLNAILQYAAGKDDEAVKAFDEIERGEKLVWFGAFLRQLMNYKQTDDATKRSQIADQFVAWGKQIWKPEDAITLAQALQYVGKTDEAKELINRVHGLFPELSDVLRVRFDLALESKDLALAEDSLNHLKKHHALQFEDEYYLAKLIEELGDGSRALEQMLDLIGRMSDKNAEFLLYVGDLFFKQGRCDSAKPYFDQSIEINTNLPQAHFLRGRCLYEDEKYEEALAEFTEAGTQDEDNNAYSLWSGLGLLKIGHESEASIAFSTVIEDVQKKAQKARSESDIENAALAYYYRGLLRKIGKNRSEAFSDFEKAIALRPNESMFREGYIVVLYENGRLPECVKQIDALHAIPDVIVDARVSFIEGIIALKANKRKEALEKLEQALASGFAEREDSGIIGVREPVEIYERLGYLYRDLGKRDEARKYLTLLLEKSQSLSPSAKHDIQNDIDKI